jgi:hypothetical protein
MHHLVRHACASATRRSVRGLASSGGFDGLLSRADQFEAFFDAPASGFAAALGLFGLRFAHIINIARNFPDGTCFLARKSPVFKELQENRQAI